MRRDPVPVAPASPPPDALYDPTPCNALGQEQQMATQQPAARILAPPHMRLTVSSVDRARVRVRAGALPTLSFLPPTRALLPD